ncbi:peptidoglycan DD-metalloendopeptidase family protein, partial [Rhodobacterales bacterium HKCCE2091]|nr:peptidoglycan DD-metalloendopeptidase family protein [Rhodobacterales bacterium HKCCE2091]
VLGTLLRRAGEPDAAGVARPGMVIAAAPGALVTAPFAGTVRYAGPLLDYGQVVLLEPDADHLIVLAGLGRTYAEAGDILPEGAALGLMPGATSEDLIRSGAQDSGTSLSETLYIEIRHADGPVDPGPWFRTARDEE